MNDFTKDELEEVKRCLKYMINGSITPYSNLTIEIKKKVQSLIENYCEHEWQNSYCISSMTNYIDCNKCGEISYDNQ